MASSSITPSVLHAPVQRHPARRAARLFTRIGARVLAWSRARSDYRDMLDLPDYLLRDVGVTRAEIESAQAASRINLGLIANRAFSDRLR